MGKPVRVILAPGQVQRSSVIELFAIDNLASAQTVLSGYIRIREAQGGSMQIVGDIEVITHAFDSLGSSVLYPISESAATNWLIPFATSTGSWFSGFAIANPNDLLTVQTDVQIEVLNSAATVIERSTISLSPRNRQASLVAVGVPSGYLRITSNMPVHRCRLHRHAGRTSSRSVAGASMNRFSVSLTRFAGFLVNNLSEACLCNVFRSTVSGPSYCSSCYGESPAAVAEKPARKPTWY
jgi:hypothetical protein